MPERSTAQKERPRFTKGEVNRAGALLLEARAITQSDGMQAAFDEFGEQKLDDAWATLTWWRSLHARPLSLVAANLRYHVDHSGGRVQGRIEVTQRLKRLTTTIGKLERESGNITQMQDIGGVRAVVPTLRHVYVVRRRLLKSWTIIRERDYVETPKSSGYRALHLIVRRRGFPIEVQLRTIGQDIWANSVEEAGMEHGIAFKFGAGSAHMHNIFRRMSDLIAAFDRGELDPDRLRQALRTLPSLTMENPEGPET